MNFMDLVRARHSIRAFADRRVEPDKLNAVLQAANQAPSAGNLQAYEIYRVMEPRVRAALARAADQSFIAESPVTLVFCANPGRAARKYGARGRDLYALQDATIAAAYAQLAATELGLATVWVGAFDTAAVSTALRAPVDWVPVVILPLGYADELPSASTRRALDDLVHEL